MSRDGTLYAEMRGSAVFAGQDVSKPEAGFFRHKLRGGAVSVGVRIYHGPPLDPVTGEVLDRSWRWQADVNGRFFSDFDRVWPGCTKAPISEQEYTYLSSLQEWGEQHSPSSPEANPHKAVNWLTAPLTI